MCNIPLRNIVREWTYPAVLSKEETPFTQRVHQNSVTPPTNLQGEWEEVDPGNPDIKNYLRGLYQVSGQHKERLGGHQL